MGQHFTVYFACGKHVRMQCLCASKDRNESTSDVACPLCPKETI